jgi:hypothetical protein
MQQLIAPAASPALTLRALALVGARLPENAVSETSQRQLTQRNRGQARSYL